MKYNDPLLGKQVSGSFHQLIEYLILEHTFIPARLRSSQSFVCRLVYNYLMHRYIYKIPRNYPGNEPGAKIFITLFTFYLVKVFLHLFVLSCFKFLSRRNSDRENKLK